MKAQSTNEAMAKVVAAAVAEAARLCDKAIASAVRLQASPVQWKRAERGQIEEFSRTSSRTERIVCDLLRPAPGEPVAVGTRDELLTAINAYCDAGANEVSRRFSAALSAA